MVKITKEAIIEQKIPSVHRLCREGLSMNVYYITFRSVTLAQRGEGILRRKGISCTLQRTPRWMEEQGCGYSLRLRYGDVVRCLELLRKHQVAFRKVYLMLDDGSVEELVL